MAGSRDMGGRVVHGPPVWRTRKADWKPRPSPRLLVCVCFVFESTAKVDRACPGGCMIVTGFVDRTTRIYLAKQSVALVNLVSRGKGTRRSVRVRYFIFYVVRFVCFSSVPTTTMMMTVVRIRGRCGGTRLGGGGARRRRGGAQAAAKRLRVPEARRSNSPGGSRSLEGENIHEYLCVRL